jgi:tetratricopeptide (TPR) repeat protein
MVVAALIAGGTTYAFCSKSKTHHRPTDVPVASGGSGGSESVSVGGSGSVRSIDAGVAVALVPDARMPADATRVAMPSPDAMAIVSAPTNAGPAGEDAADRVKAAKDLYDKSITALEEGDADQALKYADASLKLRRSARTLLERARALQRLDRLNEALASVDDALTIVSDYAPAYEQRALILWSARRYDDAKQAMRKYIGLDPNGRSVAAFKNLIEGN